MKKKYDVVFIDTGINKNLLSQNANIDSYEINDLGKFVLTNRDNDEIWGHGTSVANIVYAEHPTLKFAVFKVFYGTTNMNIKNLLNALEYIYINIETNLLQMSLGVRCYNSNLEYYCKRIYDRGTVIVSAFDNAGAVSYPAAFDFVIGVDGSLLCMHKTQYVIVNNSIVNMRAKSGKQRLLTQDSKHLILDQGNSYAASHATNLILKKLIHGINKDTLLKNLTADAEYTYDFLETEIIDKNFKIQNAAIFPCNKENYNLINNDNLLNFSIKHIFDIKYAGNIGKNFIGKNGRTYICENIEKMTAYEDYDTFILGHVDEISLLCKRDLKKEILDRCLLNKKNVYMYDSLYYEQYSDSFSKANLKLFTPSHIENFNSNKFGKLYYISTPILAVFGTLHSSGKFTLQLQIKRVLTQHSHKCGFLASEPNGLLLGANDTFLFGHKGNAKLQGSKLIEVVNEKLSYIEKTSPDLIIAGSQSGFLPKNFYNVDSINVNQIAMLYALKPDGVILTVNYDDNIEFIKRTILSIENLSDTKVIALALYAFRTTYDHIIRSKKTKLTKEQIYDFQLRVSEINLPIIVSGEMEYDEVLYNIICKHYGG